MNSSQEFPWASFCISTYNRPSFLKIQIESLLNQTEPAFEIVICDNDPGGSGENIVRGAADKRIRYFRNEDNLGMIKSFNRSIEKARTEFVVMVTDDDPVELDFLEKARGWIAQSPGFSLYGGFNRRHTSPGTLEKIKKEEFLKEILDPDLTKGLLWSSCILRREDVISIGKIPDYGSPHLADHALLALTGSVNGGMIINQMFSSLTLHEGNFSKFNFDYYVMGCSGFYNTLMQHEVVKSRGQKVAIRKHLAKWFISNIFNLKKYYLLKKDSEMLVQIRNCAGKVLELPYMKSLYPKYIFKSMILTIKHKSGLFR